ncbi:MAG: IS481 family transposase [Nitriliruptorales bacterium]|nr:IS481 family transposase [Nitriliruptorales bacterium]
MQILQTPALKGWTVEQTCLFYGVSPARFYVWRARYAEEGIEGLRDRSRRPASSPNRIDVEVEQTIVGWRRQHPRWGAQRIRDELIRAGAPHPPATSTIHRVLQRHGLIEDGFSQPVRTGLRFCRARPNELWQLDAKEDWPLADGQLVDIIDILDDHSRLLCGLRAWPSLSEAHAWDTLEQAVTIYGPPTQLLSDNATWLTGISHNTVIEFERRCWQLGIDTIHGRPHHPQTQGKIERHHQTLTRWLDDQPPANTLTELQDQLDRYRHYYNHQRPHQALGDARTPAEAYTATDKAQPAGHAPTVTFRRIVNTNGIVNYAGWHIHIGRTWAAKVVTIIEHQAKVRITFGDQLLAIVALDPDLYPTSYISTGRPRGRPRHQPPT